MRFHGFSAVATLSENQKSLTRDKRAPFSVGLGEQRGSFETDLSGSSLRPASRFVSGGWLLFFRECFNPLLPVFYTQTESLEQRAAAKLPPSRRLHSGFYSFALSQLSLQCSGDSSFSAAASVSPLWCRLVMSVWSISRLGAALGATTLFMATKKMGRHRSALAHQHLRLEGRVVVFSVSPPTSSLLQTVFEQIRENK